MLAGHVANIFFFFFLSLVGALQLRVPTPVGVDTTNMRLAETRLKWGECAMKNRLG